MKKIIKILLIAFVIIITVIQFIRPSRENPVSDNSMDITASVNVPQDIAGILERSCNDCHSNNTKWPWYSNIAPASWLITFDVNEGREHLNFSEWGEFDITDQMEMLEDISKMVRKDKMPPGKYVLLHPEAKLSDSDKKSINNWTDTESEKLMAK